MRAWQTSHGPASRCAVPRQGVSTQQGSGRGWRSNRAHSSEAPNRAAQAGRSSASAARPAPFRDRAELSDRGVVPIGAPSLALRGTTLLDRALNRPFDGRAASLEDARGAIERAPRRLPSPWIAPPRRIDSNAPERLLLGGVGRMTDVARPPVWFPDTMRSKGSRSNSGQTHGTRRHPSHEVPRTALGRVRERSSRLASGAQEEHEKWQLSTRDGPEKTLRCRP